MKENHESNKKKKRKKKKKVRIHKEKEDYLMPHQREKSSSCSLHTMKKKNWPKMLSAANIHFYKYKQYINISGKRLSPVQIR